MARSREAGSGAIADDSVDVDIAVGRKRGHCNKNALDLRSSGLEAHEYIEE
jgi:hypothetical protein